MGRGLVLRVREHFLEAIWKQWALSSAAPRRAPPVSAATTGWAFLSSYAGQPQWRRSADSRSYGKRSSMRRMVRSTACSAQSGSNSRVSRTSTLATRCRRSSTKRLSGHSGPALLSSPRRKARCASRYCRAPSTTRAKRISVRADGAQCLASSPRRRPATTGAPPQSHPGSPSSISTTCGPAVVLTVWESIRPPQLRHPIPAVAELGREFVRET